MPTPDAEARSALADKIECQIDALIRAFAGGQPFEAHATELAQMVLDDRGTILSALRADPDRGAEATHAALFRRAVYESAGGRPRGSGTEEPPWPVDLYEIERRVKAMLSAGGSDAGA